MKLISLYINNFMPYKGEHSISFPSDHQQNVMLVFGDNMRGKTSLLNAIRWCFYGKSFGRHLKEVNRLHIINWDAANEDDWRVNVNLEFSNDNHVYDLRRSMQLKELIYTPKTDNDFDIEVMLMKDGNVVRGDLINHELNQILPEDISRFFLFDGELLQEYEMLLDNKAEQGRIIKESIEKVLGVPALINGRNEIETLLREARKRQSRDAAQIESVKVYSSELIKLESEYDSLNSDLEKLNEQLSSLQGEIDVLDEELQRTQSIQVEQDKLNSRKVEIKRFENELEELKNNKIKLLKEAWKDLIQPLLQVKIEYLEKKRSLFDSSQRHKYKLESKIEALEDLLKHSKCPTCEQVIDNIKRESITKHIDQYRDKLCKHMDNFSELGTISEEINKLYRIKPTGAMSEIPNIERSIRENNLKITKLDNEIEEIQNGLRGHDTSETSKKRHKRDQIVKTLGEVENEIKDRKRHLEENEIKQNKLTKHIETNADARSHKSTRLVNTYTILKDIFSESIGALRDNLRQTVAQHASHAFSKITTESTYKGLTINENYGLSIIDRENREVIQRSAGAEQIVALSLIDGLNRTARNTGPIIMDTPLGRLDLKHRENVLKYIPEMGEQVILLVHEGEIIKDNIIGTLKSRIGKVYTIKRISSSESNFVEE